MAIFIGHDELYRLGVLTDQIFDERNRLGIINWQKIYKTKKQSKHVANATEYILLYEKVEHASTRQSLVLSSPRDRTILPTLNRCENCHKPELDHDSAEHEFKRDTRYPEWHGWHSARRGLGSNLYRLGVPDMVIQRILRHANVSTTATYYIKTAADDVRSAMTKLENSIPAAKPKTLSDTYGSKPRKDRPAFGHSVARKCE